MSKPSDPKDAATLSWKPRLKNAANRSRAPSTSHTEHVADQALTAMRRIDKRRTQGGVEEDYVATLASQFGTPAAARGPARGNTRRPGGPYRRFLVPGAVVACALATAIVAAGTPLFRGRHTVAGKVWLERQPLGTAELGFHPSGRDADAVTVTAAEDGRFELAGIAPGSYRVTVAPPAGSPPVVIAANYLKPETTPIQVHVKADVNSLQVRASRLAPKPRKATWTPGID